MAEKYAQEEANMNREVQEMLWKLQELTMLYYRLPVSGEKFSVEDKLTKQVSELIETLSYYILIFRSAHSYFCNDIVRERDRFLDICYQRLQEHYFDLACELDDKLMEFQRIGAERAWNLLVI